MTLVRVHTGQGDRQTETPSAFTLGQREFHVQEVLDRWDGEQHTYFRVIAEDGIIYILRHDHEMNQWEVTLMDASSGNC